MWQDIKNTYHLLVAILACIYFRFPSKGLNVIGVTGTDGKTTTSSLIYHILNENGYKTSLISTVGAIINGKKYDTGFHVTTPSSFAIQKFMRQAVDAGCEYMVLEVTSHALHQNRVWGVNFAIGVITNITHEHLDYHKTYEEYVEVKKRLIKYSLIPIVNADDESFTFIQKANVKNVKTYGLQNNSELNPHNFEYKTTLLGDFNAYNILAAASVCRQLGLSDEEIKKSIQTFSLPKGRMEIVYDKDFTVMVDFAHTPNSLEQLLKTIKNEKKWKRIIHVFGAAGNRDRSKRSTMGKMAAEFDDVIILTAEDPRNESIESICQQIEEGIENKKELIDKERLFTIPDRQEAINKAIELAKKGDIVVITGKGHEESMNLGNGEIPWSDQEAVRKLLSTRS